MFLTLGHLKKVVKAKIRHIIASSTPLKNLEMYMATTPLELNLDEILSQKEKGVYIKNYGN